MAAFEKVADPNIELLRFVQIFAGKILRAEKWNELGVQPLGRIRAQIRCNLLGLILKNQSSRGFEGMVMRQRQIDGLIETDQRRRILPVAYPRQQDEENHSQRGNPKIPDEHKG